MTDIFNKRNSTKKTGVLYGVGNRILSETTQSAAWIGANYFPHGSDWSQDYSTRFGFGLDFVFIRSGLVTRFLKDSTQYCFRWNNYNLNINEHRYMFIFLHKVDIRDIIIKYSKISITDTSI